MTQKEWIAKMVAPAQKASSVFGYPASVLIAQSCQENGYGSDSSCDVLTEVNNVLGMKRELLNSTWVSDYWNGDYITKKLPNGTTADRPTSMTISENMIRLRIVSAITVTSCAMRDILFTANINIVMFSA